MAKNWEPTKVVTKHLALTREKNDLVLITDIYPAMKFKLDLPQKLNTEILSKFQDDDYSFQTISDVHFIQWLVSGSCEQLLRILSNVRPGSLQPLIL